MLTGLMAALLSGAAFPIAMNVFGDITNLFINHQFSRNIASSNTLLPCPSDPTVPITIVNATGGTVNCRATYSLPGCTFNISQFFSGIGSCTNDSDFIADINTQVYIFIGLAFCSFLFSWIHTWFFQMAAERQTHRIRLQYYRAVLRQDIGWFEEHSSGEVSSKLSRYVCMHACMLLAECLHCCIIQFGTFSCIRIWHIQSMC